jgi:hypothetical protein
MPDLAQVSNSIQTRLRISWGGGTPRPWRGTIRFHDAQLDKPTVLGFDVDSGGSIYVLPDQIEFSRTTPSSYEGLDIDVSGGPDSKLSATFLFDETAEPVVREFTLEQLLNDDQIFALDQLDNRCSIIRTPGDWVQVRTDRSHLVFDPLEIFPLQFRVHRVPVSASGWDCELEIIKARGDGPTHSRDQFSLSDVGNGSSAWTSVTLTMPEEEGVYNLRLTVSPANTRSALLSKKQPTAQREVQFVVIDRRGPRSGKSTDRLIREIGPADMLANWPNPLDQMTKVMGLKTWPKHPHGNYEVNQARTEVRLPVGGWQLVPIAVDELGQQHALELDYRIEQPMALGISILQPDSAGQIPSFGFDSGIHVDASSINESAVSQRVVRTERLVFWPSSPVVYLLVSNRHARQEGRFERIRFYRTEAESIPANHRESVGLPSRQFLSLIELPILADNFEVPNFIDTELGQSIQDWVAFHEGALRLVAYLRQRGSQGAFVNVMAEGGALMPIRTSGFSARFDSGVFSSRGRDPIQKDVLEMLYRIFEREKLQLVPVLTFDHRIANLEFHRDESTRQSIQVIDHQNAQLSLPAVGPIYNPLSETVQDTILEVVSAVSDRYRQHPGYQGLAIVCSPRTPCLLPGSQVAGYDTATKQRFAESIGESRGLNPLTPEYYARWLQWRADQMSRWYRRLSEEVAGDSGRPKLYMVLSDIFLLEEFAGMMAPSLHRTMDIAAAMQILGLGPELIRDSPQIVLMQPEEVAPLKPLAERRNEFAARHSQKLNRWFQQANCNTALFVHRGHWTRLQELAGEPVLSQSAAQAVRLQHLHPAAEWEQERFARALLLSDRQMFIDGGIQLTASANADLQSFMEIFGSLPDAPFETVRHETHSDETHPVAVRYLKTQGLNYVYCVNASPWEVKVSLHCGNSSASTWGPCAQSQPFALSVDSKGRQVAQITLAPFELSAAKIEGSQVTFTDFRYSLPDSAGRDLNTSYFKLRSRLVASANARPLPDLHDAGFEQADLSVGWSTSSSADSPFSIDNQFAFQGKSSLKIDHRGDQTVWIRSREISAPETGRFSVSLWLRTDELSQPPLRISIESSDPRSSYYRFAEVGSLTTDRKQNQLSPNWQRIAVHFDDLPQQLSGLKVGFDMMGKGLVWIDQIELYDRWMDSNDLKALTQMFAGLGPSIGKTETMEKCRQILSGYWPTFLQEYFDEEPNRVAHAANSAGSDPIQSRPKSIARPRFRRLITPGSFPFR